MDSNDRRGGLTTGKACRRRTSKVETVKPPYGTEYIPAASRTRKLGAPYVIPLWISLYPMSQYRDSYLIIAPFIVLLPTDYVVAVATFNGHFLTFCKASTVCLVRGGRILAHITTPMSLVLASIFPLEFQESDSHHVVAWKDGMARRLELVTCEQYIGCDLTWVTALRRRRPTITDVAGSSKQALESPREGLCRIKCWGRALICRPAAHRRYERSSVRDTEGRIKQGRDQARTGTSSP